MEDSPKTQPTDPQKGTPWGFIAILVGFLLATAMMIGVGIVALNVGLSA